MPTPSHGDATEPMQLRGRPDLVDDHAGLVLLWAADPTALAPAFVLRGGAARPRTAVNTFR